MNIAGRWGLFFICSHSKTLVSNVLVSIAEEKATLEKCKLAVNVKT